MQGIRSFFSGIFCLLLIFVFSCIGLIITLDLTIFNPDFATAELEKLGVYSFLTAQVKSLMVGRGIAEGDVDKVLAELEPSLKQKFTGIVHNIYGSFGNEELVPAISLEGLRSLVKEYAREVMSSSPELQNVSASDLETILSRVYGEIENAIPEAVLFDEFMPDSIMSGLSLVREMIGGIKVAHQTLAVAAVILLLLICLVHWWQPKPITRSIGTVFVVSGAGCVAGSLVGFMARAVLNQLALSSDIYSQLQPMLFQLLSDILAPMRMYGFALMGAGVGLVAISLLWKSKLVSAEVVGDGIGGAAR